MVSAQPLPSLISIRAFEAAARCGGFAEAARELGTTAASVSYHVRQLEAQLEVPLFRRYPHRVELSEAGAVIAGETERAFAILRASFVAARNQEEGQLRVTTLPTLGTSWLTPRLGAFRAKHPQISIELELSADAHDLTTGAYDVAIRNGSGEWPGLRSHALFPSFFVPLCAPSLRDGAKKLVDPAQWRALTLLGRPDWWRLWFESQGLSELPSDDRFGTRFAAEHLDIAAAIAGHGIAIGSPILFATEIDQGRLVPAHDAAATDGRSFWLTYPVGREKSRKVQAFRKWLLEEVTVAQSAARDWLARLSP
ncbi:MAG: LysR substrate-binding domain-containing protein [Usitatibacteraceae bacterium]